MPSWYLKSGHDSFLAHPFHLTTHRWHCPLWATDILHEVHRMVSCFINWAGHFVFHLFPTSIHIQCVYSFAVLSTAIITGCPGERAFCTVLKVTTKERPENCALLGCYAASSGKFFTDVSGQPISTFYRVFLTPRRWDRQVVPKRR